VTKTWPVTLRHGDVTIRPLRMRDGRVWQKVRLANQEWLAEWEATAPLPSTDPPPTFQESTRQLLKDARRGSAMPFVIEYCGRFVGQINVSDIVYGSLRGCHFGYWIDKKYSSRGIMTTAVALVTDHLLFTTNLHRIEVAIRPENIPSNRLISNLGFSFEGIRPAFLHINHAWRDHNIYSLCRENLRIPLTQKILDVALVSKRHD